MILPYISYSIEAWFGAARVDSNKISVLQKKSIRAIYSLPFNAHTNDYFKSDAILKISDLYKLNLCSLVYRYSQPMVDLPSVTRIQTRSSTHSHNTRHNQNLSIPRYNLTKSQSSFLYNSIQEWNSIPSEIRYCDTLKNFKNNLRGYYCSTY